MNDKFNASHAMLGYLYQCRYALMLGIEASKSNPGQAISIEKFDDIAFENAGTPNELIQAKHHSTSGNLSDTSVDLWKTLRVWIARLEINPQLPFETQLTILTTGRAPTDSAAENLRTSRSSDDVDLAISKLLVAAEKSKNKETDGVRGAFRKLNPETRRIFVGAIVVIDNAPSITNVRSEIEDLLSFSAPHNHVSTLVDYLEGWWFAVVVERLQAADQPPISLVDIRNKIDELAEHFRLNELPLSELNVDQEMSDAIAADDRLFVRQLQCVGLGRGVIENAVRDYYRASTQRSKWARECLLLDGETKRYDDELADRWGREFETQKDVSDLSNEAGKQQCGKMVFRWANNSHIPFRNRHEMWLSTGSYQILADDLHVGWHPDFLGKFTTQDEEG